jgi:malate dehydrogenase (oxaloacetate-decarboxylating)(NADP+)
MQNREFNQHVNLYHNLMQRKGVSPVYAEGVVRSRSTVLAALLVRSGQADAMLCGSIGLFHRHLNHVNDIIGAADASIPLAAMNALILNKGTYFLCDTYVNPNPTAEQLKHITLLAAEQVRRFGITPKVALLSHSNFGSHRTPSSLKMQEALQLIREAAPELEVEGEMHADSALSEDIRARIFPQSQLKGTANMFVMPSLDAANIAFTMVKMLGEGLAIGPILLGTRYSAHIMTPSITVRGIVNMTALAVTDAQHKLSSFNSHEKNVNSTL